MPRVNGTDVKEIISTELAVEPFILAANALVDYHLGSSALSSDLLTEIERWLSAHLVATADPRVSAEIFSGAEVRYQTGKLGDGLASTPYGQQVKLLDPTGILAGVGLKYASLRMI
jgi:hypothetical protein